MTRHVSPAALARFREGDLRARKTARVSAHLTRCARCTDLDAELAGITTLLASTQAPAMPEHLAARIQDTLASEAARRVALDPGTEPGRRDLPVRTAGSRRHLRRPAVSSPVLLRTLAAAGAVVVIAGGGYLVLGQHGTSASSGSSAAGGEAGGRGVPAAHAGVPGARGAGNGSRAPVTFGPKLRYGSPGGRASFMPVSSGTNYLPAGLAGQVTTELALVLERQAPYASSNGLSAPGTAPAASARASVPAAARFGGVPVTALQGCVSRIAGADRVLLVDVARYQGRPATVIAAAPAGSAARQVWVVGPACSQARSDVLAHQSMPGG
jgi:hypothetical protein